MANRTKHYRRANHVVSVQIFCLFLCFLLISGCNANPTADEGMNSENLETAYPSPTEIIFKEAYPPQDTNEHPNAEDQKPTINPNLAVMKGVLLIENSEGVRPVRNTILYLAEVITDNRGVEMVVSMDRINSPKAITNSEGEFEFINIPLGKYGLVLDTILTSYLLNHPITGEDMLFTIDSPKVFDIGPLNYDLLPNMN